MRVLHLFTAAFMLAIAAIALIGCVDSLVVGQLGNAAFDGGTALVCTIFAVAERREAIKPCTGRKLLDGKENP